MTDTDNNEEVYDSSNPKHVSKAKRKAKRKESKEDAALRKVLSTKEGRTVIWKLLERSGVYQMSFVDGSPHQTSFNEGQRNIGNALLGDVMKVSSEHYSQMVKENQKG